MAIWIKLAVSVALLAVLLLAVDWRSAVALLLTANLQALVIAVAVLCTNMLVSTWKWRLLLAPHDIRASFPEALRAYWIGAFFSNYLPTNVGGDVVRLLWMRHHAKNAAVAASIAVERLTGVAVLAALCALALAVRPEYFGPAALRYGLWATVVGIAIVLVGIGLGAGPVVTLLERVAQRGGALGRLGSKLAKLIHAVRYYRGHWSSLWAAAALSCVFYAVLVLTSYLVLRSVGALVPLLEIFFIAPVVTLVGAIPIALNGLGITESASVLFYSRAGFALDVLVAAALLRRGVSLVVSLGGAVFWLIDRRRPTPSEAADPSVADGMGGAEHGRPRQPRASAGRLSEDLRAGIACRVRQVRAARSSETCRSARAGCSRPA